MFVPFCGVCVTMRIYEAEAYWILIIYMLYRQFSNISRAQSQYINVSRLVLQLSLPYPLKLGVKLIMKM